MSMSTYIYIYIYAQYAEGNNHFNTLNLVPGSSHTHGLHESSWDIFVSELFTFHKQISMLVKKKRFSIGKTEAQNFASDQSNPDFLVFWHY